MLLRIILLVVCADGSGHTVLISLAARLAEFVLRVTVLTGGVASVNLVMFIRSSSLCHYPHLRDVAHPIRQLAGPGLVTVTLQHAVTVLITNVPSLAL